MLHEPLARANGQENYPPPLDSLGISALTGIDASLDQAAIILYSDDPTNPHEEFVLDIYKGFSRQQRRNISGDILAASEDVISAVTGLALQQTDREDQVRFVENILADHFSSLPTSNQKDMLALMTETTLVLLENAQSLDSLASPIFTELKEEIREDEAKQYTLMQLLSRRFLDFGGEEAKRLITLQSLAFYSGINETSGTLNSFLRDKLKSEKFDGFIAKEILTEVISDSDANEDSGRKNTEFRKLIAMTKLFANLDDEQVSTLLSTPQALALWPEPCKNILSERRAQYAQNFDLNITEHRNYLEMCNFIPPKSTQESFEKAADNFKSQIRNQRRSRTARGIAAAHAGSKRKHQLGQNITQPAANGSTPAETPESKLQVARELVFLNAHGEEKALSDQELAEELLDMYLKQDKSDPRFVGDVVNILKRLKTIDLSQGKAMGVGKYRNGVKRGNLTFDSVFGFKPVEVPGLSTSTKKADKLRILFVQHEGKFGLLGMITRDRIDQLEKKLGMKTGVTG